MGNFDEAGDEIGLAFALDGDAKRRDEDFATLENTRGNRAYERSAYREAIGHYEQAVQLAPSEVVYCTNLAQAWEQLEPGRRIENLEEAQRWYERAQQVTGDRSQAQRIELLSRRIQCARVWEERALDWISVVTPIVVELAADLVPLREHGHDARGGCGAGRHGDARARVARFGYLGPRRPVPWQHGRSPRRHLHRDDQRDPARLG